MASVVPVTYISPFVSLYMGSNLVQLSKSKVDNVSFGCVDLKNDTMIFSASLG